MTGALWLSLAFVAAMGASLLLTPAVIRIAVALKLYDAPDHGRRLHTEPVPRLGGVAVYFSTLLGASLALTLGTRYFIAPGAAGWEQLWFLIGALIGSAFLFGVGLVDDIRSLTPGVKSLAQVVAALTAYYFGARFELASLGYGQGVAVGMLELPLVVLWIVGVTNAVNFIDGLDGLAGGIAVVACGTIAVVSAVLGNYVVLLPAVALAGGLLGFLRFNFPRGRIFLGDSGSLSIGFLIAVLSLRGSLNEAGATLAMVPILAVFVPLLDGALAIVRRWLRHVPVTGADARHIHHRLLALGVSPARTVAILCGLAVAMSGLGLLIALTKPFVAAAIALLGLVAFSVMLIYGTNVLSYHELSVAGAVIISAPARARRVITDQILATDLTTLIQKAATLEEVSEILSQAARQFGFVGMELSLGQESTRLLLAEAQVDETWSWKLDYPIRLSRNGVKAWYVLSIWCSEQSSARPYGAERVARVLGPALQKWFLGREQGSAVAPPTTHRPRNPTGRRLRLG